MVGVHGGTHLVEVDAARTVADAGEADRSIPGIALAALSLLVMPVLSAAQRKTGREPGSAVGDSKQTLLCTHLSAVLLAGLLANAALGWSWADSTSALAIRPRKAATPGTERATTRPH